MTIRELKEKLELTVFTCEAQLESEASGCYIGDLLSFVMSRASSGDIWITIMNNSNVAAVAVLCDISCVLLAEGVKPDEGLKMRAEKEDIVILGSELTAFELSVKIGRLL